MKRITVALLGLGLVLGVLLAATGAFGSSKSNAAMRWDIVSLNFATLTLSPGGNASAFAADGGEITLTGHGTFRSNSGSPQDVTGGGTWTTSLGTVTASGTYKVTGFVDFDLAAGSLPASFTDTIGNSADARSGLAVLQIAYSDGTDGILVVSCHLPVGSPPDLFEGITASKGHADYWQRVAPLPGVDANRTEFHVL